VADIQRAIVRYRNYCIDEIRAGRASKGDGPLKPDNSNFMSWVLKTPDDGIVGEFTSRFIFPRAYLKTINGKSLVGYGDPTTGGPQKLKQLMNQPK
jgi:hypothetical protein